MNALDELLADTGRVGGFASATIEKARTELDDAVRSLHEAGDTSSIARRTRRRVIGVVSAAGIAAAATVVAIALGSSQPGTTDTATGGTSFNPSGSAVVSGSARLATNTIELTGYRITLPANYKLGQADTNCTADLHLSADEMKRLVTTPTHGCPLLVTSVERNLPSDASKFSVDQGNHDGTIVASFIGWWSAQTDQAYLPAMLPDGTTVYVTLSWSDVGPGQADVSVHGAPYNITQLQEFEQGVKVTPASQLPTSTAMPANKPTVNCNTSCGH